MKAVLLIAIISGLPSLLLAQSKPDIDNSRLQDVLDWRETASPQQRLDSANAEEKRLAKSRAKIEAAYWAAREQADNAAAEVAALHASLPGDLAAQQAKIKQIRQRVQAANDAYMQQHPNYLRQHPEVLKAHPEYRKRYAKYLQPIKR